MRCPKEKIAYGIQNESNPYDSVFFDFSAFFIHFLPPKKSTQIYHFIFYSQNKFYNFILQKEYQTGMILFKPKKDNPKINEEFSYKNK